MTQYLMTGKSTKTMNFANMKNATRSYKVSARTETSCQVDIKINGRVKGSVNFSIKFGKFIQTGRTNIGVFTPVDITEATLVAKRALRVS